MTILEWALTIFVSVGAITMFSLGVLVWRDILRG